MYLLLLQLNWRRVAGAAVAAALVVRKRGLCVELHGSSLLVHRALLEVLRQLYEVGVGLCAAGGEHDHGGVRS